MYVQNIAWAKNLKKKKNVLAFNMSIVSSIKKFIAKTIGFWHAIFFFFVRLPLFLLTFVMIDILSLL